jgi:hypothetical protein
MGDRAATETLGGSFAPVGEELGEAPVVGIVDVVGRSDTVDGSPELGVGSDVEGRAGADAELVALGE